MISEKYHLANIICPSLGCGMAILEIGFREIRLSLGGTAAGAAILLEI